MMQSGPTMQPSRWLNARISAPARHLDAGPNTTLGSIVTSGSNSVSARRNTEAGSIIVTPASIAATRSRDCTTASAAASSTRELMPASSSAGASTAATRHPLGAGQRDHVGEVVFALGVVGAHRAQPARHVGGAAHSTPALHSVSARSASVGVDPFDDALDIAVARRCTRP